MGEAGWAALRCGTTAVGARRKPASARGAASRPSLMGRPPALTRPPPASLPAIPRPPRNSPRSPGPLPRQHRLPQGSGRTVARRRRSSREVQARSHGHLHGARPVFDAWGALGGGWGGRGGWRRRADRRLHFPHAPPPSCRSSTWAKRRRASAASARRPLVSGGRRRGGAGSFGEAMGVMARVPSRSLLCCRRLADQDDLRVGTVSLTSDGKKSTRWKHWCEAGQPARSPCSPAHSWTGPRAAPRVGGGHAQPYTSAAAADRAQLCHRRVDRPTARRSPAACPSVLLHRCYRECTGPRLLSNIGSVSNLQGLDGLEKKDLASSGGNGVGGGVAVGGG